MTTVKLVLIAAALTLPIMSMSIRANAATTHRLQTGAETQNSNDTRRMANMKQRRMMMMRKRHNY